MNNTGETGASAGPVAAGVSSDSTTRTVASGGNSNASKPAGLLESLAPILLIIVMFYFLVMRPQQKREAKNQKLRNSTKKGDRIITAGGIIGTIHKIVSDREVSLEIAENVRMRILKSSIAEVLTKGSDLAAPIHDEIEHGVSSGSNGKGTVAVVAPDTENSAKRGSTKRRT